MVTPPTLKRLRVCLQLGLVQQWHWKLGWIGMRSCLMYCTSLSFFRRAWPIKNLGRDQNGQGGPWLLHSLSRTCARKWDYGVIYGATNRWSETTKAGGWRWFLWISHLLYLAIPCYQCYSFLILTWNMPKYTSEAGGPKDTSTLGLLTSPRPQEAFQHIATSSSGPWDVLAW